MVRLSFGGGSFTEPANVNTSALAQLEAEAERAGMDARYATAPERFAHLLRTLHTHSGRRVAVLVDEYDKPILDALEQPEVARANRDYLRGLYGVIKDNDAHVRFTFLTGISKFSKVNLFSQLNNLTDITLDRRYSAICGYTESDLDAVFAPKLGGLDREQVREWYNGYSWLGSEKVYNPWDVLLLLRRRKFAAHWFETGTPAFLVDKLCERRVSSVSLGDMLGTEELLSAFDVNKIGTEALLFQTGYLTILSEEEVGGESIYRLGYPNREVRQSLNRSLLSHLVQDAAEPAKNRVRLSRLLAAADLAGLQELFHAFFASIPYQRYAADSCRRTGNHIADYEGFYASVFYSYFAALGYDIAVEESTSHGRLDMAVRAAATSSCSSSRSPSWPRPVRPSPSCSSAATPTSTAPPATPSTSSASSSAATPATSPPSRPPTPESLRPRTYPVIRRAEPRPAAAAAAAAHPSATNAGCRSACRRSASCGSCGSGTATTSTSRPSSSGCRFGTRRRREPRRPARAHSPRSAFRWLSSRAPVNRSRACRACRERVVDKPVRNLHVYLRARHCPTRRTGPWGGAAPCRKSSDCANNRLTAVCQSVPLYEPREGLSRENGPSTCWSRQKGGLQY